MPEYMNEMFALQPDLQMSANIFHLFKKMTVLCFRLFVPPKVAQIIS